MDHATLREERDYWRSVAEDPYDWEYWQTPDGSLRIVSPICEDISGYAPADFHDDPGLLLRIVHADDRACVERHLASECDDGPTQPIEFRIYHRSGDVRWIKHRCRPVFARDGRFLGRRARNIDITGERRAESAYNSLAGSPLQGLFVLQDERFVFANDKAAEISGYTVDELLAMSADEATQLIHPEDREQRIRSGQEGHFADAPPRRYELRIYRKDGSFYWVDIYATYTIFNGRPAVQLACVDVTERKEAEAAYRTLVDNSLQGIFLVQGQRLTYVNRAFAAMLGREPEELQSMSPAELRQLIHPDDLGRLERYNALRNAGEEAPPHYESRWIAKDGSTRWLHASVTPTTIHGSPAIQASLIDVTERHLADLALRDHAAKLHAVFENAAVAVNLVDVEGRFIEVNRRFVEFMGYSREELLRKTVWEVVHPDDLPLIEELAAASQAGAAEDTRLEVRYIRADGSVFWGDLAVRPVHDDDGNVTAAVGVVVDVTERKSATSALHENQARYRDLIDHAGVAIGVFTSDGAIQLLNAEAGRVLGVAPQEVLGSRLAELPLNEAAPGILALFAEAVATGEVVRGDVHHTLRGQQRAFWVSASPLPSASGEPVVQMIAHDISERKRMEEHLQELSAQTSSLLDSITEAFIAIDRDCTIRYINRHGAALLGAPPQALLDRSLWEVLPEARDGDLHVALLSALEEGAPVEVDYHAPRSDRWYSVRVYPSPGGLSTYFQDVTEARTMELEIREHMRRLAAAEAIAHLGSWELDVATGACYLSDEFYRICGYEPGGYEPTLERALQCLVPEEREYIADQINRAVDNRSPYRVDARLSLPNGAIRWVQSLGEVICDESGAAVRISGSLLDIHERKEAERALRESEARFTAFLDHFPGPAFLHGADGRVLFANRSYCEQIGRPAEQVVGHSIREWLPPPQAIECERQNLEIIRDNRVHTHEQLAGDLRAPKTCLVTRFPVRGAHDAIDVGGIAFDITARKALEADLRRARDAANAASQAKSDFLATMSHELRTPLNAVIGMAELLKHTDLSAEQAKYITTIQTSSDLLLALISDVLDFSKIEAGELDLESRSFELRACVLAARSLLAQQAADKGLELTVDVDASAPATIVGDATRVLQILVNLLSNAVKFTERGRIDLAVARAPETDAVTFRIRDTGIGMSPDQQARIFKPFTQADASTSRQYGGTGLGLVISRRLARAMGGELRLESALGRGSTFTLELPLHRAAPAPTPSRAALPDFTAPPGEHHALRILLAEDNPTNQVVILGMLKALGYRADAVQSGQAALDAISEQAYDVVLMDVQMPERDGLETTRMIRHELADARQPFIVALTAHSADDDRRRCLDAGMDAYLSKPIRIDRLASTLTRAPRLRAASDERGRER